MTISKSVHPQYDEYKGDWQQCRDAYKGQKAIKARGAKYLPKLGGMTESEYLAYKERALFYSITAKTVTAMVGMAMSRQPVLKYPDEMKPYFEDAGGIQMTELYQKTLVETILMGRVGVLVDRPVTGGDILLATYITEAITNWFLDSMGKPTLIVLAESIESVDANDPFSVSFVKQYRKLFINAAGVYQVELYDELDQQIGVTITPTLGGRELNYIPFYVVNPNGISWDVESPPMLDIVDINISHYRTSADLEHGRHWTGLPTPVVSGVDGTSVLKIGSQAAWILPNENAKAYMLEFTGQGLQSLEKALAEKQSQLASMSSRLMDNSKRGSESPDTVRLRFVSETATLVSIVRSIEAFINTIYKAVAEIEGANPNDVTIQLNKEFLDTKLSSAEIRELVSAYLEGAMSKETLVFNLRRGDLLSSVRSDESEIDFLIKSEVERKKKEKQNAVEISDGNAGGSGSGGGSAV